MSGVTGIIAAEEGKTINDEPLGYSSRNSHLLVDTSPGKTDLDILEMRAGDPMTVSTSASETKEFIFHKIPHHLKFIPKVSVKFYVRDVPAGILSGIAGSYGAFLHAGGVPFEERIFFRVDGTYVYFVHQVSSITSALIESYTSQMQDGLYRIKYIIFQNEGMDEPYDSLFFPI